VKLTEDERTIISIAKVAATTETDSLIKIIERLIGETVEAADSGSNKGKYSDPLRRFEYRTSQVTPGFYQERKIKGRW
jgi:hypothetical protein